MPGKDETWKLVSQRVVAKDDWVEVYENDYRLPDDSQINGYHALKDRDGVIIVALTPDRDILMVRQYRPGIDAMVYELPAGFMEQGETDTQQRAEKELEEETGYRAKTWHSLGVLHDAPHRVDKTSHCFLALDVQKATEQHQDSTEFVQYDRFPPEQVRRMIVENEITSGVMVAALFRALLVLQERGDSVRVG